MGILGRMYKLLNVAGPTPEGQEDRRPLQLQINEAQRELDRAVYKGQTDNGAIQARIEQMQSVLAERNHHGQELERQQDQLDAAMALYEANVDDMFDGPHPYVRLMQIYDNKGALEDAKRVARACLAHVTSGLPEDVRALCLDILQRGGSL